MNEILFDSSAVNSISITFQNWLTPAVDWFSPIVSSHSYVQPPEESDEFDAELDEQPSEITSKFFPYIILQTDRTKFITLLKSHRKYTTNELAKIYLYLCKMLSNVRSER